jgi:hypothetical protein
MSLFQTIESDAPKGMTILTRRGLAAGILASAAFAGAPASTLAQEVKSRELPPARTAGGMPLMDAVKLRRSTREYADRPLTDQVLSDLLWAAFGINRPDGGRTAPYSRHIIAIDVYAAMADGVWLYEPKAHTLLPVIKDDIRAQTGVQDFVGALVRPLFRHAARRRTKARPSGEWAWPRRARDASTRAMAGSTFAPGIVTLAKNRRFSRGFATIASCLNR